MQRKFSLFLVLLLVQVAAFAHTRSVYFVGNSYTYTNSMPNMLQSFATAMGDTLITDYSAPGGYTFQLHTTNATTISGIYSRHWDVVVLQEQSQMPSFPPSQVATDVYPYAARLDSFVNDNDTCTEVMYMMTWGRKTGDAANCPTYSVVCTYAGMQARLRESYMEMATDNRASVAPVGAAWKIVVDSFPSIELYQADESHPSVAGSYLQTCVFYASVFHRPASGCTYLGGLAAADAAILQRIADKVVFDSLEQWQQHGHYPYAGQHHTYGAGRTVMFSGDTRRSDSYSWNFGDGANDTALNPTHIYSASGIYTVSFTVQNECFTETRTDTVFADETTSVIGANAMAQTLIVSPLGQGNVLLRTTAGCLTTSVDIYAMDGRRVVRVFLGQESEVFNLPAGLYVYRALDVHGQVVASGKVPVY